MSITLTKVSETASKITLGWTPVPNAIGYRFQSATQAPKWSHTFDATRNSVTFAKAAWYKVEALGVEDAGEYPAVTQPPPVLSQPPNGWTGPISITAGGTYDGTLTGIGWRSTSSVPAITINTSQPVTIKGWVQNTANGQCIYTDWSGAQVTIEDLFAYGISGNSAHRWLHFIAGWKHLIVRNCTIDKSRGMQIENCQTGGTLLITRNRHTNIQGQQAGVGPVGNFVQYRDITNAVSAETSWNEIINEPHLSSPEDLISFIASSGLTVADNYFQHQSRDLNPQSQNGITLEASSNNQVLRNQVIDGAAIGIWSGTGNIFHNNRIIQDGRMPDGSPIHSSYYEPIYISGSNNHAHGNTIGYINGSQNYSYGSYPGAPEGDAGERANNTYVGPPVTRQMELDEWTFWQNKLTSNGITVGVGG